MRACTAILGEVQTREARQARVGGGPTERRPVTSCLGVRRSSNCSKQERIFPLSVNDPSNFNNLILDHVEGEVIINNKHPISE